MTLKITILRSPEEQIQDEYKARRKRVNFKAGAIFALSLGTFLAGSERLSKPIAELFQTPYSNPVAVQQYQDFKDGKYRLQVLRNETDQKLSELERAGISFPKSTRASIEDSIDAKLRYLESERNVLLNANTRDLQEYQSTQNREKLIKRYSFPASLGLAILGAVVGSVGSCRNISRRTKELSWITQKK